MGSRLGNLLGIFCHLLDHGIHVILKLLQRPGHSADFIGPGCILFLLMDRTEITGCKDCKSVSNPANRRHNRLACPDGQSHEDGFHHQYKNKQFDKAGPESRICLFLLLRHFDINIINPNASSQHPFVRLIRSSVVTLRQRLRLIRLGKYQIREAAPGLAAILNHFLDKITSGRINGIDTGFSLGIAAQKHHIDTLISVNPEIPFAFIVAKLPDPVSRFFLGLLLCQFSFLLLFMDFFNHRDGNLGLVLQ